MHDGEELVLEPFKRLIEANKLMAYKHEGFWRSMDTLRDRQVLEDMVERGEMPWRPVTSAGKRRRWQSPRNDGLPLAAPGERLSVLCLGAHSDDIEIGAGGTILAGSPPASISTSTGACFSAPASARRRLQASAAAFLEGASADASTVASSATASSRRQGRRSRPGSSLAKRRIKPDVVLTHRRGRRAPGPPRRSSRLTWNTFRDHLILEYEIPKWDGDLGQPNVYVPLSAASHGERSSC